ncbi:hypothetical protein [Rothia sp. P5766]|uniref:hypothetical protein n=1 Tax=Rothia sp. P5766 TaxID=3402656 RepID=UPI003AD96868
MSESVEGKKPNGWRYMSPWERVRNLVGLSIFLVPMVYGVSWVLFSAHFNRAFHYEKQCTIEAAGVGHSRTKSYSGSSYISVKTADCGVVEFHGRLYGLRRAEVAERIDALAGQRVAVDVGYWQLPYNPMMIVGVEGLDLGR